MHATTVKKDGWKLLLAGAVMIAMYAVPRIAPWRGRAAAGADSAEEHRDHWIYA